jgi:hypothetical protein
MRVHYLHLQYGYVDETERVLPDKSAKIYGLGRGHGLLRVGSSGPLTLKEQSTLRQTCSASTWLIFASSCAVGSRARGS